ncbi:MAG: hypothetical protein FWE16_02970 [Firmicutes bacterium]|nr:hypothetical protein [Bacillota bacterium]
MKRTIGILFAILVVVLIAASATSVRMTFDNVITIPELLVWFFVAQAIGAISVVTFIVRKRNFK